MVVDFTLAEINKAVVALQSVINEKKIIAFHGEMGAGKTTLIHALCEALQTTDIISSPTFAIINEYHTTGGEVIYHMDLYRLKGEQDAIAAGVEDCLYSGNLCLVEWPEKAPGIFPEDTIHCYLKSTADNARKLQINL